MASGRLAAIDITNAATDTQLYVAPSGKTASFSVSITNRNSSAVKIRLALTATTSIALGEYVAYDVTLYGNEVYERSGFVLAAGQYVFVRSSNTGVNAVVYGYEE
jgi:hypothetical protein